MSNLFKKKHRENILDAQECASIMSVVSEMELNFRPKNNNMGKWERRMRELSKLFFFMMGVAFVLAFSIKFYSLNSGYKKVGEVGEWVLVGMDFIGIFAFLSTVTGEIISSRKHDPKGASIVASIIIDDLKIYLEYIERLAVFKKINLQYVANNISRQCSVIDQKRHFLAGVVEKAGIIPLIVATITAAPHIIDSVDKWGSSKMPAHAFEPIGWALVFMVAIFYLIGLASFYQRFRWDRIAWIVDWVANNAVER